ncbi:class I SAM-dependent methyltransferase [Blastococcus haudaquaticus]|uniref:Methyltransferase domain-containing protein n=1 Tax=Blastococcus haudaquaticus TaxID=1938745 RepID=A0A286H8N2_9ACTN|nr:class I SAM-dependent methyltransferase [Blastococcus haudaquaticus]SOE04072.1 Methyltransferase domain-containing protein [Blastococcus haudaquaticus]
MPASERLAWTAEVVGVSPSDRVLEVGCGHGVLVSLLAERLTDGVVIGVDRSATMIATAARRNRAAVDAGRVRLAAAVLTAADLDSSSFDLVVSFNVRAFWTPPAPEWDVVDRILSPGGRVFVAFSVMKAGSDAQITEAVERLAGERGLVCAAVHRGGTSPMESVAVELHRR